MKKRVFISVMVFLQVLVAWGQLSVGSFTRMENDLTARIDAPKRDQNGDVCAIIKVVTNQTDFVWEPDALGIVAAEKKQVNTGSMYHIVQNDLPLSIHNWGFCAITLTLYLSRKPQFM